MTDATIQKKLDQLVKIANELDAEAKLRYGASGNLFIKFYSKGYCTMGAGAW